MEAIKKLTPEEKLTPAKIAKTEDNPLYSIPIYQRLFEWDTENINTLLFDLRHSFDVSKGKDDYYIGMLTSTESNELVDGQQRFVVMMLIGCVLKNYAGWKTFIGTAEQPRLHFSSRPKDNKYLEALIEKGEQDIDKECINVKMKNGIEQISAFLQSEIKEEERGDFAKYIYEHLSFFITQLPDYSPTNLNLYFERMNTTGRNLEQHEILKVKLLRHLDDSSTYMQLWNRLADVDTLLITLRENEKEEELYKRKNMVIQKDVQSIINENVINVMKRNDTNETSDAHSIEQIAPQNKRPSADGYKMHDSHCPLSFPELLLQTLYLLKGTEPKDDFFNTSNLLDTFSKFLPYEGENVKKEDIKSFMIELLRCRLILDVCFIRRTEDGYSLDMNLPDLPDENESKKKLMMYESMLYVSSSNTKYYKWFGWLMSCVKSRIPSADELCEELKRKDNVEHTLNAEKLSYHNIDRYWFWRLDYYLWEDREKFFSSKEAKAVADNYVFRRNRSIEHIAPQTPKSDSAIQWNDTKEDSIIRDSFGNLAMISSGSNSSLSNESFEVKRAHVASYCNNSKVGSIESLKLLWVYDKYKTWNKENIKEHGEEMIKILRNRILRNSLSKEANNCNVNAE